MIDSHQHFWKYDALKHAWINDEMQDLRSNFLPGDLAPILAEQGIAACVAVQADESEAENEFLLNLAAENSLIKGVVGWLDFLEPDLTDRLDYYSSFNLLKGFRYILQGHEQRDLMLSEVFKHNIGLLNKYGFTYDILIFPDQLKYAEELVSSFPNQRFVLDHMAKPLIKSGEIHPWKQDIIALSKNENVCCKVSGMLTEADWKQAQYADFSPYLDEVFEAFGSKRVLFGSDWPVCNLAGGYDKTLNILSQFTDSLSTQERTDFYGENALKFYHLTD